MTQSEQEIQETIKNLLSSQRLAALSTQRNGQPYTSLMAFACTEDLKEFVVATGKATRRLLAVACPWGVDVFRVLDRSGMMGQSNVAIMVGQEPVNDKDLPTAIGSPMIPIPITPTAG